MAAGPKTPSTSSSRRSPASRSRTSRARPNRIKAGIGAIEAALMARLGYQRYGVQGGDWGSIIGTQMALNDAPHVAGLHINMCTGQPLPEAIRMPA